MYGWQRLPIWAGSRAPPVSTLSPTCVVMWSGVPGAAWIRWPLAADLELYIRWMQELRRLRPSTVSRRFWVAAGFYRTCVIDGVLEHSPAEHVRRRSVPPESPTLGFTHLQFEALLTASRESANQYDFALVAMLGLLGLRIFEATGANIGDLGEEHGHRVFRACGKGGKVVLVPLPPAVGRAIDRAVAWHPAPDHRADLGYSIRCI
jgi:integrase